MSLDLTTSLIPLLLVDAVNPVLFALVLTTLSGRHPVLTGCSLVAGHTTAYFLVGLVAALGLEQLSERLLNPYPVDYLISSAVGLLCLFGAYKLARNESASAVDGAKNQSGPAGAFVTGAVINFVGAPFAVPYLAAVDQILRADLTSEGAITILVIYNLTYALPFLLVAIAGGFAGASLLPTLQRVNNILTTIADFLMPILLLLIGLGLLIDSGLYFWTGEGLI